MSLIALDACGDFSNRKLYGGAFYVSLACCVYQNLLIAALLVTLESCTPKNVWCSLSIYNVKFVVAIGARMAGEMAALKVGEVQQLRILRPVPSDLGDSRLGPVREDDFFTTAARASDSANNQSFTVIRILRLHRLAGERGQC
jgi:hypothetical protein